MDEERREDEELHRGAVEDEAEGRTAWSSTITSWIIVSSRCVLGSSNGMRRSRRGGRGTSSRDEDRSAAGRQARRRRAPSIARGRRRPSAGEGEEAEEERRLGEAAKETSRAAPIPSKRRAGVERRRGREEPREGEEVDEEETSPAKERRRAPPAEGRRSAARNGGEGGPPGPARTARWSSAEEAPLRKSGRGRNTAGGAAAPAPGDERLGLADDAEEERREGEERRPRSAIEHRPGGAPREKEDEQ